MTTIIASTTDAFFGEPVYLQELTKDIVAAALKLSRDDLKFTHVKADKASAKASIVLDIDTLGSEKVEAQIVAALTRIFSDRRPTKLTFAVNFAGHAPEGVEFDTDSAVVDVVKARVDDVGSEGAMFQSLLPSAEQLITDYIGEEYERAAWFLSQRWED